MIFKQTVNNKCHHYFTIIQLHMSEKNIAPKYQFTIATNKSKPFNSTTHSAKIIYDLWLSFTSQFSARILTGEEGKYSSSFMERA